MFFNKKFKNIIKLIPLIFSTIALPFVSIACKVKNPYIYTVGDEWMVSKDFTLKFESLDYQIIEDIFEIKTTFIFNDYNKKYDYILSGENIKISYTNQHFYLNKEKSIELSGFNILGVKLKKSTVVFVFDVPLSLFYKEKLDYQTEEFFFRMQIDGILTYFVIDSIKEQY